MPPLSFPSNIFPFFGPPLFLSFGFALNYVLGGFLALWSDAYLFGSLGGWLDGQCGQDGKDQCLREKK